MSKELSEKKVREVLRRMEVEKKAKKPQGYDIRPNEDMSGHGWVKEVTFKFLNDVEGKPKIMRCTEVDFYTKDFMCQCGSNKFLWFAPQRNGVYLCCTFCRTSEGPLSHEAGIVREEYEISIEEALQIMRERGWKDTDELMRVYLKRSKGKAKAFVPRARPNKST